MANNRMTSPGYTMADLGERGEVLRSKAYAHAEAKDGVVLPLDERRAAQIGRLLELPSMMEVFGAWEDQRLAEACEDYAVDFRDLLMAPSGRLAMVPGVANVPGHDRGDFHDPGTALLPMTYRTFGNLIRHYCSPPRNSARNLIALPTVETTQQHTGRSFRASVPTDSPRAHAYNAWLDMRKAADERVARISGDNVTTVILRTRKLRTGFNLDNTPTPPVRTAVGVVSPNHCLRGGDDDKLMASLMLAFAGSMDTARASAYRGVDESELRAFFPALKVLPGAIGAETWTGYITARNSESGAKSWSISAGLYRERDGASVACEAIIRTGRHVGSRVDERMVDVAQGAAELLHKLVEKAGELSRREWEGSVESMLVRLQRALRGTALDGDAACGIAWALGEMMQGSGVVTVGMLIDALGRSAAALELRVESRPIEVMLGRMLVDGWAELKAVDLDGADDGRGEE